MLMVVWWLLLAFMASYLLVCFFFFQAEDGIRDYKVTGVQTCALPILSQLPAELADQALADDRAGAVLQERLLLISRHHDLGIEVEIGLGVDREVREEVDRKSTRLNSSHLVISYAVFCLKKKNSNTRHV